MSWLAMPDAPPLSLADSSLLSSSLQASSLLFPSSLSPFPLPSTFLSLSLLFPLPINNHPIDYL